MDSTIRFLQINKNKITNKDTCAYFGGLIGLWEPQHKCFYPNCNNSPVKMIFLVTLQTSLPAVKTPEQKPPRSMGHV